MTLQLTKSLFTVPSSPFVLLPVISAVAYREYEKKSNTVERKSHSNGFDIWCPDKFLFNSIYWL